MKDCKHIDTNKFEFIQMDTKIFDKKFETKAIGYFGDALRRFVRNKSSVMGFVILVIIIIMSIIGPYVGGHGVHKQNHKFSQLPARIPLLEKIGIADGTRKYTSQNLKYVKSLKDVESDDPDYGKYFFEECIVSRSEPYTAIQNNQEVEVIDFVYNEYKHCSLPYISHWLSQKKYDELKAKGAIIGDPIEINTDYPTHPQYKVQVDPLKEFGFTSYKDFYYLFGTDLLGRDMWSRVWSGTRVSLLIGLFVALVTITVGVIYGSISGYYGGTVDLAMQRFAEILSGIPWIAIMTLVVLYLGANLFSIALALVLTSWIGTSNMVRSQFYRYKGREYVLAARTLGAKDRRLIFKHILPNALGPIVTSSVLIIPNAIFSESMISYLGLGLSKGVSIGKLLADGQAIGITTYPYLTVFPAIVISLLMISFNLFGNGLRDALNPSLRGVD
ncbi:MAG TPA: ABC transporter permease [Bacilli bacterium]|nr:ABC transporter permease [Bacilli bacterium]HPZ27980.1 ABC transporter permease [Bacilli bacterium]HQC90312.1 ABC transporter permease [Bacilli bacterium]